MAEIPCFTASLQMLLKDWKKYWKKAEQIISRTVMMNSWGHLPVVIKPILICLPAPSLVFLHKWNSFCWVCCISGSCRRSRSGLQWGLSAYHLVWWPRCGLQHQHDKWCCIHHVPTGQREDSRLYAQHNSMWPWISTEMHQYLEPSHYNGWEW